MNRMFDESGKVRGEALAEIPAEYRGIDGLLAREGKVARDSMDAGFAARLAVRPRHDAGASSVSVSDGALFQIPQNRAKTEVDGYGLRIKRALPWMGAIAATVLVAFGVWTLFANADSMFVERQIAQSPMLNGSDSTSLRNVEKADYTESAMYEVAFDDSDRLDLEVLRSEAIDLQDRLDNSSMDTDLAASMLR